MNNYEKPCSVARCDRNIGRSGGRGMCPRHYKQFIRNGFTGVVIKKCKDCSIEFERKAGQQVRCYDCQKKRLKQLKLESIERCKKEIKCINCKKSFIGQHEKFCCRKCFYNYISKKRIGKGNPSYRGGFYCGIKQGKKNTGYRQCAKYSKKRMEIVGYNQCERCGCTNSVKYEVHHIVFRSEAPKHENIHHEDNFLFCCITCHNELHKRKKERDSLLKIRKAKNLFKNLNKTKCTNAVIKSDSETEKTQRRTTKKRSCTESHHKDMCTGAKIAKDTITPVLIKTHDTLSQDS